MPGKFRKKTELLLDIFKLPAKELVIPIDTVLTAIRRFNYPWNHSLFKSYNPTMRKMTKREGAAELTRNIYLDLEIAIPTLFGRDDRATYHKIYYNAEAIKNRWFSQLVALRILQRRRYLVHFEVPTASHRSDFHRLWRRVGRLLQIQHAWGYRSGLRGRPIITMGSKRRRYSRK